MPPWPNHIVHTLCPDGPVRPGLPWGPGGPCNRENAWSWRAQLGLCYVTLYDAFMSVYLPARLSFSFCLSACLPTCLSGCLSVYLPSVCLSLNIWTWFSPSSLPFSTRIQGSQGEGRSSITHHFPLALPQTVFSTELWKSPRFSREPDGDVYEQKCMVKDSSWASGASS